MSCEQEGSQPLAEPRMSYVIPPIRSCVCNDWHPNLLSEPVMAYDTCTYVSQHHSLYQLTMRHCVQPKEKNVADYAKKV